MNPTHGREPRESRNAYLVFSIAMSILVTVFIAVVQSGCDDCDDDYATSNAKSQVIAYGTKVKPTLSVNTSNLGPETTATRGFTPQRVTSDAPATVNVTWWPPDGATSFQFSTLQPSNLASGPPFHFDNVPVAASGAPPAQSTIQVSYQGDTVTKTTPHSEIWSASAPSGEFVARVTTTVNYVPGDQSTAPARATAGVNKLRLLDGPYSWWRSELYFYGATATLTPTLCSSLIDATRGGRYFVAVQMPTQQLQTGEPGTYDVPFVERGGVAPHLDLRDYTRPSAQMTVVSMPLEVDPARTDEIMGILPQDDDSLWMALTPTPDPGLTCPQDLDAPDGAWEAYSEVHLDFGGAADACDGCLINVYGCYEGSDNPFDFLDEVVALTSVNAANVYQGSGVTCAGPLVVQLGSTTVAPIDLSGPGLQSLDPPGQVKFHHYVQNRMNSSKTVSFALQSSQGINWRLYLGDPSLNQQITGPLAFGPMQLREVWTVADVPALGSPLGGGEVLEEGVESVTITVTTTSAPGEVTVNSDIVWLGGWTPPPVDPVITIAAPAIGRGAPVIVSGALSDGAYRLAVVPNGSYTAGSCYTGNVVASVDVVVSNSTLPATTVWGFAMPGSFDVLALSGACGGSSVATITFAGSDATIITGDDLSSAAGLEVSPISTHLRRFIKR